MWLVEEQISSRHKIGTVRNVWWRQECVIEMKGAPRGLAVVVVLVAILIVAALFFAFCQGRGSGGDGDGTKGRVDGAAEAPSTRPEPPGSPPVASEFAIHVSAGQIRLNALSGQIVDLKEAVAQAKESEVQVVVLIHPDAHIGVSDSLIRELSAQSVRYIRKEK